MGSSEFWSFVNDTVVWCESCLEPSDVIWITSVYFPIFDKYIAGVKARGTYIALINLIKKHNQYVSVQSFFGMGMV